MTAPLQHADFESDDLMTSHPPVWRHPKKRLVFAIACPEGTRHRGTLGYSRWAAMRLPEAAAPAKSKMALTAQSGFYDYQPTSDPDRTAEWHVNFADPHLFVAYGTGLFAQDEMQVAEHPALGALCEALDARGLPALTVEGNQPTPVLITGVERRCQVATEPNAVEGRPAGLYGNNFAAASAETILRATRRIDPPTVTNLIAMAGIPCGWGEYTADQIRVILTTAFTGFQAAVLQSRHLSAEKTVIQTGFWGCGAFGGNRVLMALLQIIAASMAQVNHLVFHTGDRAGAGAFTEAANQLPQILHEPEFSPESLVDHLAGLGFCWGESDGN